ncbi:MAG TPA: hypothetical protein VMX14_07000 [Anaerolineae bacterium]|nr:hypothetical protein [Anaerolineae bacterium]
MIFQRYPECAQVIVNCKTDSAFRGVLWRRRRGYLVLRNATLMRGPKGPIGLDGEIVIDARNVDFIQVISNDRS